MSAKLHMNDIMNSPLNKPQESVNSSYVSKILQGEVATGLQKTGSMHVHIEITKTTQDGNMNVTADIDNSDDLETFWIKTEDYMPAKNVPLLQRLRRLVRR